jgi:hypothetical protein
MRRIQVLVDAGQQEHFRRQAEREGLSLSAWLRRAEKGREPDWDEHEAAIARSRASGQSGT